MTQEALGPYCPSCGHRNPVRRVRCERCAAELWPGAATPVRRMDAPAAQPAYKRRRRPPWGTIAALIAVPIVAALVMYLLAYALS